MSQLKRIDILLVEKGLVESRERAQRLIMAGQVRVKDQVIQKASQRAGVDDPIEVLENERYVSRGGYKLEAAFKHFPVMCKDLICLDLGASTGGFTDCLLQHGARKVYAVDVGENQIAWKLRNDPRVKVLDKLNARYLQPDRLGELIQCVTADVAFISLTKVLPAAFRCVESGAQWLVLIKPQFEAGREKVMKGGVVSDPQVHQEVIDKIRHFVEKEFQATWRGVIESPLVGPAGNKEFLAWFSSY
jgi:23S rRNA (cytidine1920-2'-O)/16S rRNA (cytidine1409-2'-O)-methyltransferase